MFAFAWLELSHVLVVFVANYLGTGLWPGVWSWGWHYARYHKGRC